MRYVIIGGSIAGVSAAQAIREQDSAADIRVISGEKSGPYYRPVIPVSYQRAEERARDLLSRGPAHGEGHRLSPRDRDRGGCEEEGGPACVRGAAVLRCPPACHRQRPAETADPRDGRGGRVSAQEHGPGRSGSAMPRRPRGAPWSSAAAWWGSRPPLPCGSGAGLKGTGPREVTVVEMLPEILSGRLDRRGSRIIRDAVEREGVTVLTNRGVAKVVRDAREAVTRVQLSSGGTLKADLVIVAAGVRPNISCLKGSGVQDQQRRSGGWVAPDERCRDLRGRRRGGRQGTAERQERRERALGECRRDGPRRRHEHGGRKGELSRVPLGDERLGDSGRSLCLRRAH